MPTAHKQTKKLSECFWILIRNRLIPHFEGYIINLVPKSWTAVIRKLRGPNVTVFVRVKKKPRFHEQPINKITRKQLYRLEPNLLKQSIEFDAENINEDLKSFSRHLTAINTKICEHWAEKLSVCWEYCFFFNCTFSTRIFLVTRTFSNSNVFISNFFSRYIYTR